MIEFLIYMVKESQENQKILLPYTKDLLCKDPLEPIIIHILDLAFYQINTAKLITIILSNFKYKTKDQRV